MADSKRKHVENTEDILASIRKTMMQESGEYPPDEHSSGKPVSGLPSDTRLVQELRQLIDEYTDLPEDLVTAVTQLEMGDKDSPQEIGNDPFVELKEVSENATLYGDTQNANAEPLLPDAVKQFLEGRVADMGIPSAPSNRESDDILFLMFKIFAYRWLDQNLEPLVKKLVRAEIERLAKTL